MITVGPLDVIIPMQDTSPVRDILASPVGVTTDLVVLD